MINCRFCHRTLTLLVLLIMLVSIIVPVSPVLAADHLIVSKTTDDEEVGSLREAIASISPGGTITFDSSLSGETITLSSTLVIDKNMIIDASALDKPVTISGKKADRVFSVNDDVTAKLVFLVIQDGMPKNGNGGGINNYGTLTLEYCAVYFNESAANGGGISNNGYLTLYRSRIGSNKSNINGGAFFNNTGSTLNITESTVFENTAGSYGGGIYNAGTLTITASTFSKNMAGGDEGYGGGILNVGTAMITNSTLSGNIAIGEGGEEHKYSYGGGIFNYGYLTIKNSTLFGNHLLTLEGNGESNGGGIYQSAMGTLTYVNTIIAGSTGGDCVNGIFDDGIIHPDSTHNLVEDGGCDSDLDGDPKLGLLAYNGGLTQTHALLSGSPAIDAGSMAYCPDEDQRGVSRPQDGNGDGVFGCDIGAFELEMPLYKIYMPLIILQPE